MMTFVLASIALAAPPEEIRIGSLGSRGVSFTDEWPRSFDKAVAAAGDVNADGMADFLLLHFDAAADDEPTVFLVYGKPGLPEAVTGSRLPSLSTVFRLVTPHRGADIQSMAPAGDVDAD